MPSLPRTYLYFFIFVALLFLGIVAAWQSLGTAIAIAALVSLALGTAISFWRLRELHRGAIISRLPNRVSALPEKWHNALVGKDGPRT